MKNIVKNLWRYKQATILNVIGLSTAFAAFILIAMQLRYDISYNKQHENYESIYMLSRGSSSWWWSRPHAREIKENVSEIEYLSVLGKLFSNRCILLGDKESDNNIINTTVRTCHGDLTKIFTFNFIDGDANALYNQNGMIVSERFAKKWYGNKSPIGQHIMNNDGTYIIGAVFETFTDNGFLRDDVFVNVGNIAYDNYENFNNLIFVKTVKGISKNILNEKVTEQYYKDYQNSQQKHTIQSEPLSNVRYTYEGYSRALYILLFSLAILIVVLAAINFINFTISMVPLKIKGINLRKIMGARVGELRIGMIAESVILILLSFIIALGLVELLKDSTLNSIFYDSTFKTNILVYLISFGVALVVGIVSGLYPAFYATSFPPALILKSNYALSVRGVKFRKWLIGFQFFVTFCFIIGAFFIHLQHNFMMEHDGGYIKEGVVRINHGIDFKAHELVKQEFLKHPMIKDVTFTHDPIGVNREIMSWGRDYSKGRLNIDVLIVAHNFLDFFGIKMIEGRNFTENDEFSENGYFLATKSVMDKYDLLPNENIEGHRDETEVIGVCENVAVRNIKVTHRPLMLYIYGKHPWNPLGNAYIKVTGNSKEITKYIHSCYKKADPNTIVDINYIEDEILATYKEENTAKYIMQCLSVVAIVISLIGVLGLVSFDTKYRRKEISLRRIQGATVNNILKMFSISYVKILLIAFCVAAPAMFLAVGFWLVFFAYQVDLYWWVFASALLIVFVLTNWSNIYSNIPRCKRKPYKRIEK